MYFLHALYLSVFRCISVGVVHTRTVGDRDVRIWVLPASGELGGGSCNEVTTELTAKGVDGDEDEDEDEDDDEDTDDVWQGMMMIVVVGFV